MKSGGILKPAALVFFFALLVYVGLYRAIEHHRTRNGPWEVTFTNGPSNESLLLINQPSLHITNFTVLLRAPWPTTNMPSTLRFREPRRVPFIIPLGECVFLDTTILPGTVVFRLSGHEIELLPRVLVIDRQEIPWSVGSIVVTVTNR